MNFEEAEARFRQLQARVQRGEPISRAEYEEQVSQLAVQDRNGVLWEINPRTGKWMYFDGAEWVSGTPPGHDSSSILPLTPSPTPPSAQPPAPVTSAPVASTSSTPPPPPPRALAAQVPASSSPAVTASVPPVARTRQGRPSASPKPPVEAPAGGGDKPPISRRQALLGGHNREWIPLAILAAVLLICAPIAYFGGNFVLGVVSPKPTATRTPLALPSSTALPTPVRLPTQAPPTATAAQVLAKVNENTVNVRNAPSTSTGKIITTLKRNAQITLVGRNADSTWYQVAVAGQAQPGWIFAATLDIVSGDPKTLPVGGTGAPAPAATKPPAPAGPTATPTVIGVLPPATKAP